jgi:hypothetical protein
MSKRSSTHGHRAAARFPLLDNGAGYGAAAKDLDLELWERQPEESEPAWAALKLYRDMQPKRSLRILAASIAQQQRRNERTTVRLLERWSSHWNWPARCAAYDN